MAREIRLRKRAGEAEKKPPSLTVAPEAGGIGGKALPEATPTPSTRWLAGSGAVVVVESAGHDNSIGSGGLVRIFGTVRNAGDAPACDVVISVRLYDSRDRYLASGSGRPDEQILKPGGRSSYSAAVQVPPGVAQSLRDKDLSPGTTQGSVTLEGTWRTLGRAEAEAVSVAGSCPGDTSAPAAKESEPRPAEAPTATPR